MKITDWAVEDRPRERLWNKGPSSLSDAELLAILIGSGTRNHSALGPGTRTAGHGRQLTRRPGQTQRRRDTQDKRHGRGKSRNHMLLPSNWAGAERWRKQSENPQIRSSSDVFNIMCPVMEDLPHEEFWILFLNRANRVTGRMKISQGGVSGTVTDVRIVMKKAIEITGIRTGHLS